MVQVPPAARTLPEQSSVEEYPPDAVTLAIERVLALLVFLRVTVRTALVLPASRLPKSKVGGVNETAAVVVPNPVPVSPSGGVPNAASVVTVTVPTTVPLTVGTKLTFRVQLPPAGRKLGQLLVCE